MNRSRSSLLLLALTVGTLLLPRVCPRLTAREAPPGPADVAKGAHIERPIKQVLDPKTSAAVSADGFANPRVRPGLVHWHPTLPAACEAARRSGKPVLLFQMLGKLDEQFC